MSEIKENHIALLIKNRMEQYADKVMMRFKEHGHWKDFKGAEINAIVNQISNALFQDQVQKGDRVGIIADNSPYWSFADLAILGIGGVSTPIYATNLKDQIAYILKDAAISILFVGDLTQLKECEPLLNDPTNPLQKIILLEANLKEGNSRILSLEQYIKNQPQSLHPEILDLQEQFTRNDLASIIYTSGTTGFPKGAMISHGNMIFACSNHDLKYHLSDTERSLAFLPLSHIFERLWTFYIFHKGMQNTYCGDPKQIAHMLKEVRPTVMCSVPRLYEKIYDMIFDKAQKASWLRKKLFNWSIKIALKYEAKRNAQAKISKLLKRKYQIADQLVLSKIRAQMGGDLKFMPCGGAYLSNHLTEFFRAVGLPIVFGYGLSETTATVSSFDLNNYKVGSVGKIMPNTQVKIGPNDEIWVKSDAVMQGYYKKSEENAKSFEDGWFKTGDAGFIDSENHLYLKDRIKDLIKTSGGKYIAPQAIEGQLLRSTFIEQIMMIGEGKPFASALIIPNIEALKRQFPNINLREKIISEKDIKEFYHHVLTELQSHLAPFERVKKFTILKDAFSMENNEMTPTFKLKRKYIQEKYAQIINAMYA